MKLRSKFNYDFTNPGCFRCAILKPIYDFKEKRAHKARDMKFLSKCSRRNFRDFEIV